uniref:Uncharacterized protein n=1 Tax=Parascaris equorum TaxID=6256 RepID=A0A914R7I6_PAREQ
MVEVQLQRQMCKTHFALPVSICQIRDLLKRFGSAKVMSFDEFHRLFSELRSQKDEEVNKWKERIGTVTGTYTIKGMSEHSNEEIAGIDRRLTNFTTDVVDSEIYTYLMNEIAPKGSGVTLYPLS